MARTILIIDDETSIRESLKGALLDEGYQVHTASSGLEGIEVIRSEKPDLVLLDIWMPELDGLETLKRIKEEFPSETVIMMSGHGTIETAVRATKLGAYDFAEKPLSLEKLLVVLQNALHTKDLATENDALKKSLSQRRTLIGESKEIQNLKELIRRVAPTTGSVLITGENGTGKELVAHQIHALSPRFGKPFIEVNCAAIPEELIESELFGHERGAFTGATQLKRGKFDLAHGGTLFLDEIGDMSLKTQAKILRILQEQKFERVGGTQTLTVDVRIVAATNKDLKAEIKNGNFREDLFYRLNVVPFHVPALRDRKRDIAPLALHFCKELASTHQRQERLLSQEALKVLTDYSWPGNVRELKNLIERIIILSTEKEDKKAMTAAEVLNHLQDEVSLDLSENTHPTLKTTSLRDARQEFEKDFILKTLKEQGGNISKTASILGVERTHLHRKMKSYGIELKSVD